MAEITADDTRSDTHIYVRYGHKGRTRLITRQEWEQDWINWYNSLNKDLKKK